MGDESECQITRGCQIPLSFFRLLLDFGRDIFDFSSGFVDTVRIARREFGSESLARFGRCFPLLIVMIFCLHKSIMHHRFMNL